MRRQAHGASRRQHVGADWTDCLSVSRFMELLEVRFNESGGPGAHRPAAYALRELAPSADGAKNLLPHAKASGSAAHEIESELALPTPHDFAPQLLFVRSENLRALSA